MAKTKKHKYTPKLKKQQYEAGEIVFCKLKGFPWWPAKIVGDPQIPDSITNIWKKKKKSKHAYTIYFYGSLDYASFKLDSLRVFDHDIVQQNLAAGNFFNKDLVEALHQALDPNFLFDWEEKERLEQLEQVEPQSDDEQQHAATSTTKKHSLDCDNQLLDYIGGDRKRRRKATPPPPALTKRKSLEAAAQKCPEYDRIFKRIYLARHKLQRLIYDKKPGVISTGDHPKIDAALKYIEDCEMTKELLKDTKVAKIVRYGCSYAFIGDHSYNIQERCLTLIKVWATNLLGYQEHVVTISPNGSDENSKDIDLSSTTPTNGLIENVSSNPNTEKTLSDTTGSNCNKGLDLVNPSSLSASSTNTDTSVAPINITFSPVNANATPPCAILDEDTIEGNSNDLTPSSILSNPLNTACLDAPIFSPIETPILTGKHDTSSTYNTDKTNLKDLTPPVQPANNSNITSSSKSNESVIGTKDKSDHLSTETLLPIDLNSTNVTSMSKNSDNASVFGNGYSAMGTQPETLPPLIDYNPVMMGSTTPVTGYTTEQPINTNVISSRTLPLGFESDLDDINDPNDLAAHLDRKPSLINIMSSFTNPPSHRHLVSTPSSLNQLETDWSYPSKMDPMASIQHASPSTYGDLRLSDDIGFVTTGTDVDRGCQEAMDSGKGKSTGTTKITTPMLSNLLSNDDDNQLRIGQYRPSITTLPTLRNNIPTSTTTYWFSEEEIKKPYLDYQQWEQ